jgi:exosortase
MVTEAADRSGISVRSAAPAVSGRLALPAAGLLLLNVLLWAPLVPTLVGSWRGDDTLSHGPLVPVIAGFLLWSRREDLRRWDAAYGPGLWLLGIGAVLHVLSVWADVAFLGGSALVLMLAATVWYLGGARALGASAGALGFLPFMLPWPTTVSDKLAFPMQLASSSYAALLGGLIGLPVHRQGVELAIQPDPNAAPVYQVLVARGCSGLTSMIVLLALAYLVAYATPVRFPWKALLVGSVIPLAIVGNALRLTLILIAGANRGEAVATWVHDHEAPFLIFLCSLALMGIRAAILAWVNRPAPKGARDATAAVVAG